MKKTNFDSYLDQQLSDQSIAAGFDRAGDAWDVALQTAETDALLCAENQERYRAVKDGTVTCIPADEAMRQARERSNSRKL